MSYQAPLDDMRFVLYDVFSADQIWQQLPAIAEQSDRDTADAMLEEAAKLARDCLYPINRSGDEEGVRWEDGNVYTPEGFKEAYKLYCESGWTAMTGNPEYEGLGMPKSLSVQVEEMMYAANSAFTLYPSLSAGASLAIDAHASEELKTRYLPKLYSGVWAGTMCLTEPHAGSDLGLLKTKAIPQDDGTYSITGTKIFITGGEHDLSENIVHLVLAKLPDAPGGSKGISLFLVPKLWINEDGSFGDTNGVSCGSTEHKMGIHASATCVMNFDGAKGFLVGKPNEGLKCMFTMMNYERLSIGIQGLGSGEMSYQRAVAYAKDRLQGRAKGVEGAAPIIHHGDIRRMLMNMRSITEGGRALSTYTALKLDQAKYSEDSDTKKYAQALVALLTPVTKAFFTDMGLDLTVQGQQVLGGHGYVREWGQEQLVRDVRIAQIYEGTNGIQALDLLGRKVLVNGGQYVSMFCEEIDSFAKTTPSELAGLTTAVSDAAQKLKQLTESLIGACQQHPDALSAHAVDYLNFFGYVTYGYMWLQMAAKAQEKLGTGNDDFYQAKLTTAQYYVAKVLPRIQSHIAAIEAGAEATMELPIEAF